MSPPFPALGPGVDLWFNFRGGCAVDDAANMAAFKAATGFDGTTQSALLMLLDRNGNWIYFQIPDSRLRRGRQLRGHVATCKNIHVRGGHAVGDASRRRRTERPALADPVSLVTGIQVISFRVLTDPADNVPKLQQKLGPLRPRDGRHPATTTFVNVMENVEDLQVAYIYAAEPVWEAPGRRSGTP